MSVNVSNAERAPVAMGVNTIVTMQDADGFTMARHVSPVMAKSDVSAPVIAIFRDVKFSPPILVNLTCAASPGIPTGTDPQFS